LQSQSCERINGKVARVDLNGSIGDEEIAVSSLETVVGFQRERSWFHATGCRRGSSIFFFWLVLVVEKIESDGLGTGYEWMQRTRVAGSGIGKDMSVLDFVLFQAEQAGPDSAERTTASFAEPMTSAFMSSWYFILMAFSRASSELRGSKWSSLQITKNMKK
jgi:hypothetical protein